MIDYTWKLDRRKREIDILKASVKKVIGPTQGGSGTGTGKKDEKKDESTNKGTTDTAKPTDNSNKDDKAKKE